MQIHKIDREFEMTVGHDPSLGQKEVETILIASPTVKISSADSRLY